MKIKVITDTAADLPLNVLKDNDITVVPLVVSFEDKVLRLGKDISYEDYYELLDSLDTIPNTAAPDPASFYEEFKDSIEKQGYDFIFCVTVGNELSATYSSAMIAAKKMEDNVHILNSASASGVEGLIALNIVELANKGKSVDEIKRLVNIMKEESHLCAGFHTLENIYKFGRLKSKFILNATKFIRIKPIIVLEEKGDLQSKLPGFFFEKHMLRRLINTTLKKVNRNLVFDMVISHISNESGAEKLKHKIKKKLKIRKEYVTIATPLVGTHTGKRTLILSLVPVLE